MSSLNQFLFNAIHQWSGRSPLLDGAAIFLANDLIYLLVAGFIFLLLSQEGARRKWYLFFEAALAVIVARGFVTETFQFFYVHPRPFAFYGFAPLIAESGSSFPSGHVTLLFTLAMLAWYVDKKWSSVLFVLSLVVGIARIYAGVHWPFDVLGGIAIGIVCSILVHVILRDPRKKLFPREDSSLHAA